MNNQARIWGWNSNIGQVSRVGSDTNYGYHSSVGDYMCGSISKIGDLKLSYTGLNEVFLPSRSCIEVVGAVK